MTKHKRHAIRFSAIALGAMAIYFWMASGTLSPVQAEDRQAMGAGPEQVMPVPGMHEQFEQEERDARIEELPTQF